MVIAAKVSNAVPSVIGLPGFGLVVRMAGLGSWHPEFEHPWPLNQHQVGLTQPVILLRLVK